MSRRELLTANGLTRADLLRRGVGFAAGISIVGLAACAGDDDGGDATPGTTTGASEAVKRGGILQVAVAETSNTESLDPALQTLQNDKTLNATLHDALVRYDSSWNVEPWLAESWEASPDAREWTFVLRDGVKFHDGSALTAEDVAYSIGRLLDEELGSPLYARISGSLAAEGIQPVDDRTIRFVLTRPDSLFPLVVGTRQAHIAPAGTTDFQGVGTGPFMLKSFDPGRSWEVERNPDWWQAGLPYLDGVRGVAITEQATKLQSVASGESHVADPIDALGVRSVEGNSDVQILTAESDNYLVIAMDATQEPFTDGRVQMAVKLAVDRAQLLEAAVQGLGSVTSDVPVPADDPFFPPSIGIREQDIEGAKQLLADAGYADGIDLTLWTSPVFTGTVDLAVAFKEVVAPAGIRVEVKQHPADTYFDQVWLTKPMYVSYWNRRHPNEALTIAYASDAEWNEPKFKSEELDRLLAQGLATVDEDAQLAVYQEALALVANEAGTMIPFFINTPWPAKANVQGITLDPQRIMFHEAWLA